MRILQIDKFLHNHGGSSRVFLDTIDGLRARGREVAEFSMQDHRNRPSVFTRYFPPALPEINSKKTKFARAKAFLNRLVCHEVERRLGTLISDFRPDVAHIHDAHGQSSASIFRALQHRRVPTVISVQEAPADCNNLFEKFEKYYYRFSGIWKDVRLFICPSEFMANKMAACGFPKEKMRVIRNPFSLPPNFPAFDAKLAPAICYENCEAEILEALGHGRIVVACRGAGNSETIIDGESGFLFSPSDPESLQSALRKASSLTTEQAGKIIERGRQLVLRDHNPDQYFRLLNAAYEEALRH